MRKIKIVSRASILAKVQAKEVGKAIMQRNPSVSVQYTTIKASADRDLALNITKSKDVGLFTKDISKRVIDGEFDLAIHSWKDLPIDPSPDTEIVGTLPRGDVRDMLIIKKDLIEVNFKKELTILTSSPRRMYNLNNLLSDLIPTKFGRMNFIEIRGNIETRLNKFITTDADIFVVAKVALDRLLHFGTSETKNSIKEILNDCKWIVLPLSAFPTAPGQGAIAIEAKKEDLELKHLVKRVNCKVTFSDVLKEKSILAQYGGGCHQKIGVSFWNVRDTKMCSLIGETEEGKSLRKLGPIDHAGTVKTKYISDDLIYPNENDKSIFRRKPYVEHDLKELKNSFLLFSRKNIFDDLGIIDKTNILWTSGVKAWKYAVSKGYWINGSLDNMGENYEAEIGFLLPKKLKKYKMTHKDSTSDSYEIIPKYELHLRENIIKNLRLDRRSEFFWMSPLHFKKALEYFPEILNGNHSCGPGRTYDYLKKNIPKSKHIRCYFSYDHWLEDYKNG